MSPGGLNTKGFSQPMAHWLHSVMEVTVLLIEQLFHAIVSFCFFQWPNWDFGIMFFLIVQKINAMLLEKRGAGAAKCKSLADAQLEYCAGGAHRCCQRCFY